MAIQTLCLLRTIEVKPAAIRKVLEAAGIRVVGIVEVSREEVRPEESEGGTVAAPDSSVKGMPMGATSNPSF